MWVFGGGKLELGGGASRERMAWILKCLFEALDAQTTLELVAHHWKSGRVGSLGKAWETLNLELELLEYVNRKCCSFLMNQSPYKPVT